MEILTREGKKVNDGFFAEMAWRFHKMLFVQKNKNYQKNIQKNTKTY